MEKRRHNQTDLIAETMQRLRSASRRIGNQRELGVEIDPAFAAASVQTRVEMLYSALGEMPTASSFIVRIDTSRQWGPGNVCWSKQTHKAKTLHAGDWSPTAQCVECKSYRTKITGKDSLKQVRTHKCECGKRFATQMLDVGESNDDATVLSHDGQHLTIREWSFHRQLTPETIRARIANGWSVQDALDTPLRGRPSRMVTLDGRSRTIEDWAEETGIKSETIKVRLARGLPPEQALRTKGIRRKLTHDGFTGGIKEWALRTGLSETAIRTRMRYGWTDQQILETPRWKTKSSKMLTNMNRTQSVAEWSRETGISVSVIRGRLKAEWSVKRTLETPVIPRRMLTWVGRTQTVAQWARELGINVQLIKYRLRRGWTASEIFETPPGVPRRKSGEEISGNAE